MCPQHEEHDAIGDDGRASDVPHAPTSRRVTAHQMIVMVELPFIPGCRTFSSRSAGTFGLAPRGVSSTGGRACVVRKAVGHRA
jgi:hypothetical protein